MAFETNPPTGPMGAIPQHEIQVGSQKFTLVDGDKGLATFVAGKDKVLQNGKEIDGKEFLKRFGLNPKVSFKIFGLVDYFSKLNSLPTSPITPDSYSFSWTSDFCKNSLAELCLPQSKEERIASLFANRAEQEAAGLQYAQKASELLRNYGKSSMVDKYKLGDDLLREAKNQLAVATSLLGETHPQVKALQAESTSKLDTQQRVKNIIHGRIFELYKEAFRQCFDSDGMYYFFRKAQNGKFECPAESAADYKDRILKHEAAKRVEFQELAAKLAAFQRAFGDFKYEEMLHLALEMLNNPAVRKPVTIMTEDGEVIATLEPLLAE